MNTRGFVRKRHPVCRLGLIAVLLVAVALVEVPAAGTGSGQHASVSFRFDERLLMRLGLETTGLRGADGTDPAVSRFAATIWGDPRGGTWAAALEGGFSWRAFDPVSEEPRPPLLFYGATIEVNPARDPIALVRSPDPGLPAFLEVRNTSLLIEPDGSAELARGDLHVTREWAHRLNDPFLAGRWVGALDVRFTAGPDLAAEPAAFDPEKTSSLAPDSPDRSFLDVALAELWSIAELGRDPDATYPEGTSGLSAATTSCNVGEVDVPWRGPMFQDHPLIGLAVFRRNATGTLEMISKNWIKHGFQALSDPACSPCQNPSNGTYLAVGCSDTYSVFNNGWTFYLGPRDEINPYTAAWDSCGSFFDGTPADCIRDDFGDLDPVKRRLEVRDADLEVPGATYFYEGIYLVADDDDITNNIAWREFTATWSGTSWDLSTVDVNPLDSREPNPGPVVLTWGDVQDVRTVAPRDGQVMLATRVTDVGGGTWHYEYALYNRNSHRAIRAFSMPIGTAKISNAGFRDIDQDPSNDWTTAVSNGLVTWETDEFAADPNAPVLTYQTMFNFRFDADRPPAAASATAEIFRPGIGSSVLLTARGPDGSVADAGLTIGSPGHIVLQTGPNPFRRATTIRFSLDQPQTVRLTVLDVAGRTVRVLLDGEAPAGVNNVRWLGQDASGSRTATGVYFYRLETATGAHTLRGTLLK